MTTIRRVKPQEDPAGPVRFVLPPLRQPAESFKPVLPVLFAMFAVVAIVMIVVGVVWHDATATPATDAVRPSATAGVPVPQTQGCGVAR